MTLNTVRTSNTTVETLLATGASTQGGMVRDAPRRKLGGGNFVMIMMLLLVSIIIYYYMNAFITLHQCTFNEVKIATLGDVKGPTVKLALLSLCP